MALCLLVSLSSAAVAEPNPVKEVTDYTELPVYLPLTDDVQNLRYSSISDEVSCADFEYYGAEYTLRAKASAELEDISGVYVDFANHEDYNLDLSGVYVHSAYNDGAETLATWFDEESKISFSLYSENGEEYFGYLLEYFADNSHSGAGIFAVASTTGSTPVTYPVVMLKNKEANAKANESIKSFAESLAAKSLPTCKFQNISSAFGALSVIWIANANTDERAVFEFTISTSTGEAVTPAELKDENGVPLSEAIIKAFKENPASVIYYDYGLDTAEADAKYDADTAYIAGLSDEELSRLLSNAGAVGFAEAWYSVGTDSESSIIEVTLAGSGDNTNVRLELKYYKEIAFDDDAE